MYFNYIYDFFFRSIPPKSHIILQLAVPYCKGVNYLEHVQAKISLSSTRRGDIQIYLTSPAGTKVTLLTSRYIYEFFLIKLIEVMHILFHPMFMSVFSGFHILLT